MQFSNNLKQIGLSLQNYHDVYQSLPYGARARFVNTNNNTPNGQNYGPSWLVSVLPFCEQKPLSDLLESAIVSNPSALIDMTQSVGRVPFHANNQKIAWMLCPSSPLPQTEILRNGKSPTVVTPSYVGISGSTNHLSNRLSAETPYMETRLKPKQGIPASAAANVTGSSSPPNSQQSWGGMLCPNECYGMAACIDGTSNTMLVSEKSDYFYGGHNGKNSGTRYRIDGSFSNGGTGQLTGGWWWLGTNNGYTSSQGQTTWVQSYNITTIRAYGTPIAPLNSVIGFNGKNQNIPVATLGQPQTTATGVIQGIGQTQQNNPLISAHPNVVLAVFMDGHTQAVTKNTPAPIVKRVTTRDDGQQIGDY
jgi:hypothetical protein